MIRLSNGKCVSILIQVNKPKKLFSVENQRDRPTPPTFQKVFKNNNVPQTFSVKHLCVILDFKLTFEDHLNNVLVKVNKAVGLLRKLRNLLPRTTLITISRAFMQQHLEYGDVLYDQTFNDSFKEKLESIQYNACLALTGTITGASKEKSIRNWDWSPFEIAAGVENFAFFIRSWKIKILHIFPA